jgi:hypothetical protein
MRYLILLAMLAGCAGPARSGPTWAGAHWDSAEPCEQWDAEQRPECNEGKGKGRDDK